MDTKKHRTLAILACGAFLLVTLFFVLLFVCEADHDCIGEDCPVCTCIHQGKQTLKRLGMSPVCGVSWMSAACVLILGEISALRIMAGETLVSQKVRANN